MKNTPGKLRAQQLIEALQLNHLNVEAGLFSLVTQSSITVTEQGESLPASNVIYLMLSEDEPINYIQRLESDDYQILIEGGPADYFLFYPDGYADKITMGRDVEHGQQMIVAAPGGTAKAIVLHESADYILGASVVTPAWTPRRTVIGADDSFIDKYINKAPWATRAKLLELIGPNFGAIVGGADDFSLVLDHNDQMVFQGMQLSTEQLQTEIRRFADRCPGKLLSVVVEEGASDALVEVVKRIAEALGVIIDFTE